MAYPPAPQYPQQQPQPSGPKARPTSVTAVVWTQFVTAALLIVTGISQFAARGAVEDEFIRQFEADPALADSGMTTDDIQTLITFSFALTAGVFFVFAVFYLVLGLLNNKGKRPARILSWILSGLGFLCCGLGGLMNLLGSTMFSVNGQEYSEESTQAMMDATPGWLTALNWINTLVLILGSLVIIILLAVPASNEFFRKDEPPMGPYPGQPYGQPGQPPYGQQPGQPPYGQQPPGPPQQ